MSNDIIYNQIVEDLRCRISVDYVSVKAFCEQYNIGRHNLCRVFNRGHVMSLELYIRLCVALNVLPPERNLLKGHYSCMTLPDFLSIQNDIVLSLFFVILDIPNPQNKEVSKIDFSMMCRKYNDDCANCGFYCECDLPEKHLQYVCRSCGFSGEFHEFEQKPDLVNAVFNKVIPEYPLSEASCPECHKFTVGEK